MNTYDYVVPVSNDVGRWVVMTGLFPLSEKEWAQFMAVLQAMRPGLVRTGPGKGWNQ